MNEMPQFLSSNYGSTTGLVSPQDTNLLWQVPKAEPFDWEASMKHLKQNAVAPKPAPQLVKEIAKMTARIVKVYMADTDENVPAEKRILYVGDEKFTDATDQELFFEIPVQELLKKHNAYRVLLTDKKATAKAGKDVMLEPMRIRDLKMVVVTVAQF